MPRQAQLTPQPTPPPRGNVAPGARKPGQPPASSRQGVAQGYGQMITGSFMPAALRTNGHQTVGPSPQTPKPQPIFNGGRSPRFMPPGKSTYQAATPPKPVPQPMTRYNFPSNAQMDPQSVQERITTPPVASNSMPPPATKQPATNTAAKRAADQPLPQQSNKKQRKPTSASTVPQPPVSLTQQPAPVAAA